MFEALAKSELSASNAVAVIMGDALRSLQALDSESVQCIVTSPPYWGMRDYGDENQIGFQETLYQYLFYLGEVFSECKRVLKDDGVFWLNIGDGYTSGNRGWRAPDKKNKGRFMSSRPDNPPGMKNKDLQQIPWRLLQVLQSRGWYIRSDNVWLKPNCQPESVKDRPTRAHEFVFLCAKSEKYSYDSEAVKEKSGDPKRPLRNRRTVWPINTQAVKEAHFATFPEELVNICLMAGSKEGDLVLDPFAGSGTTLLCAKNLGRRSVGIEINKDYVEIIKRRVSASDLLVLALEELNVNDVENTEFPPLDVDLQAYCANELEIRRAQKLQPGLAKAIRTVPASARYQEALALIPEQYIDEFNSFGVPVEYYFPLPCLVERSPEIIGYYRLLYGVGSKKFSKGSYGAFSRSEALGKLSKQAKSKVVDFCRAMIDGGIRLYEQLPAGSIRKDFLHELTLLSLGSALQGKHNNLIDEKAMTNVRRVFARVLPEAKKIDENLWELINLGGDTIRIIFARDPDVAIYRVIPSPDGEPIVRNVLAIEVKGGQDAANMKNRLGESEKSHIVAKGNDFNARWTIGNVRGQTVEQVRKVAPNTTDYFFLQDLIDKTGDYSRFAAILRVDLGLKSSWS